MQVSTATHSQPTLPNLQALFFPSAEHAQDDRALGHAHLSTVRAQRAFRAAGVAQAWLMGRAPEIHPGKVPARVVGILSAGQIEPARLLEHIDSLEHVLRYVCGTPVKIHCFFLPSAVPTSATAVAIRGAGDRPELPIPAIAPSVPPPSRRQASANDPVSRTPPTPPAPPARALPCCALPPCTHHWKEGSHHVVPGTTRWRALLSAAARGPPAGAPIARPA